MCALGVNRGIATRRWQRVAASGGALSGWRTYALSWRGGALAVAPSARSGSGGSSVA